MEKGPKKKRAEARFSVSHDDVATAYSAAAPSPSSTAFIDRRMRPCLSTSRTLTLTMSPSLSLSETFTTRSLAICETCTRARKTVAYEKSGLARIDHGGRRLNKKN